MTTPIDWHLTADVLLSAGTAAATGAFIWQSLRRLALAKQLPPLRTELDAAQRRFGALDTETAHLAKVRLPAVVDSEARRYRDVHVPGLAHPELADTPADAYHQDVIDLLREGIGTVRDDISLSARSVVRDLLEEPQTFLVRAQNKVFEEMEEHGHASAYVQGLMGLDHLITKALHRVQRLRILSGSWPGMVRSNATFYDIVESARGRIDPHPRVQHVRDPNTGDVWIRGRHVEPLAVALAELLDNATAFCHATVYVSVHQVQAGYCIVVDDSGPGLNVYQKRESVEAIRSGAVMDVTGLTDSLALGWYVVGRCAAEYGFDADVTGASPYGGVRAVLLVPVALVGEALAPEEESRARRPSSVVPGSQRGATHLPDQRPEDAALPHSSASTAGLPQRRRRQPLPPAARNVSHYQAEPDDPATLAAGMANLADAFRTDIEGPHTDD